MNDSLTEEVREQRKPNYDIHPLIVNRWSPRSMTGEELSDGELMPLFEAARWAPSSNNAQLWRFVYAKRETKFWDTFVDLLAEGNKVWARQAAVLVVVTARKLFERNDKPAATYAFDAGAAWENLALEGTRRGLVVHGMQGFDYEKARTALHVPDHYDVLAMIAIGKRAPKESLPTHLQEREQPNDRRPLEEIIVTGRFKKEEHP
ncbi:MAG: nitroreductase family protein [Nitrospira sp.]|nr:nitroreductase family protein [Nitrospira sp.]